MVDPIGSKPGPVVDRRAASIGAAQPVAAPKTVAPVASEAPEAAQVSQAMAAEAPVDSERVARIRKAVQDGRFPLIPSTIADRLLALKLEWNPNDAS